MFFKGVVFIFLDTAGYAVAKPEPTPCYYGAFSVGTPRWACSGKSGQKHRKTSISPLIRRLFLVGKRTVYFFWGVGGVDAAYREGPVLGRKHFPPGQFSVEFVNIGGWLTYGDLALDSCVQFLAVAEHRLIPSRVRSIGHLVWAPACQDQVAGGHAWVGVASLGRALALPAFAASEFMEFSRLGKALRVTPPLVWEEWFIFL